MIFLKLLFVIVIFVLYGLFARSCLKLLNLPITIRATAIFVISGGLAGMVALIVQGVLLAEQQGHIGEEPQILNMFVISVIIAVVVSTLSVKIFYRRR